MIFVDTNVVSETLRIAPDTRVLAWLEKHDAVLALCSVVIGELAFGIEKIRPDQRAKRLSAGLEAWRQRCGGRIFGFTEEAALAYGTIMGKAARRGHAMSAQDGMIAAIVLVRGGALATRNTDDFEGTGIDLVNPWAA